MYKKVNNFIGSYLLMSLLVAIYAIVVGVATFVESYQDTISARVLIYNSWWFILIQLVMVLNFCAVAHKRGLVKQKKYGALLLHYGFVAILLGALTTHLFGREGIMAIREGEESNYMLSSDTYVTFTLKNDKNSVAKSRKVSYGKLVKDKFHVVLEGVTSDKVEIKFSDYMGDSNSGMISAEVKCGEYTQKVAIEGGRYMNSPATTMIIEGAELQLSYGSRIEELPFSIYLNDFKLERYPGSMSPSSYSSDVAVEYKGERKDYDIYMNNIGYVGNYRLYQTSYDKDEKGTILTVNQDMVGTTITYIGYIMLAIGLLWSLLHKQSRFSQLYRRLKEISVVGVMLFALLPTYSYASSSQESHLLATLIDKETALEFSKLLVQNPNGRVEPLNSYALKLLRKLHRSSSYKNLTPTQVLVGIISSPYVWSAEPLLSISNKQLAAELNATAGKYLSYASLFDSDGNYVLQNSVSQIYAISSANQSKYQKEVLKLDEKANILHSLFNGEMLRLFPIMGDEDNHWISMGEELSLLSDSRDSLFVTKVIPWMVNEALDNNKEKSREVIAMIDTYQKAKADPSILISERKVNLEIFYNDVNIFKHSALSYLAIGAVMLIALLCQLLKGYNGKTINIFIYILSFMLLIAFLWQTFGIGLRWYISGRAPWTNSYESMIYVGWSALLLGLLFVRRSKATLAIAALMAGAIMMISQLNLMDPEITPLVPVLKSYWLMFHVATITASYGFFGVAALIGIAVIIILAFSKKGSYSLKIEELTIINEMSMTIGLVLLTIGIFIGAVWANESWGRYWGWDPKESWALITMIVYSFVIHARFIPSLRGKYIFNVMSIYAFYTVLMTFFGVNYYLTGMHSYGNSEGLPPLAVIIPTAIIIALTIAVYRNSD
ncbi:MAG: cytochrome c biogenesis protein CcsA [Rikenellaceae bacterium]